MEVTQQVGGDAPGSGYSGGARFEAPWPGLIARPAFVCCGTCPPRGHSIASVPRSAGLHPLRISLYARAAGSRDATVFSVTLQYLQYIHHRHTVRADCVAKRCYRWGQKVSFQNSYCTLPPVGISLLDLATYRGCDFSATSIARWCLLVVIVADVTVIEGRNWGSPH